MHKFIDFTTILRNLHNQNTRDVCLCVRARHGVRSVKNRMSADFVFFLFLALMEL